MNQITKFLFGNSPSNTSIVAVSSVVVASVVLMLIYNSIYNFMQTPIQYLVVLGLVTDLSGGVLSNLTNSTKQLYNSSVSKTVIFLFIHFLQPLVLGLTFQLPLMPLLIMYVYMLCTVFTTKFIFNADSESQTIIAASFTTIGLIIFTTAISLPAYFTWFSVLYIFKLVFCFSTPPLFSPSK